MRVKNNVKPKEQQQSKTKPVIHNVFILDSSASMNGNKYNTAVGGINLEVETLKTLSEINYTHSLVEFGESHSIKKQIWFQDIKKVTPFNGRNFYQNTALHDAIGFTITEVLKNIKEGEKVLLKIFTDGQENASKKYNSLSIKTLIKEAENKGFTVTFEGTQEDTETAIGEYDIQRSNVHVHDNTTEGLTRGVQARVAATVAYSKAVLDGEDVTTNFYTKTVQ